MRTAQLVCSAVALALTVGVVVLLSGLSNIPIFKSAAVEHSVVVLPPLWCLLAGLLTRRVGWKVRLTVLTLTVVELLLSAYTLVHALDLCRRARSPSFPTYILGLSIGICFLAMAPFGTTALVIASVTRWLRWRTNRTEPIG